MNPVESPSLHPPSPPHFPSSTGTRSDDAPPAGPATAATAKAGTVTAGTAAAGTAAADPPPADTAIADEVDEAEAAFDTRVARLFAEIVRVVACIASGNADLLRLLAEFADLRPPEGVLRARLFDEFAPEEIAGALGVSAQSAAGQLMFACSVVRRLPGAVDALKAGVLDLQRLYTLENAVRPLDDDQAAQVEARVLAGGARPHRKAFTDACRRAVHRVDAEGAAARSAARRAEHRVWVTPGEDNTSALTAVLPSDEAQACYQRIDHAARAISSRRADGDERTRDQIRADVLVDMLTGRAEHGAPLPCEVQVIVPVTTLLGMSTDPGEIPGQGPIPAAVAREMAHRPGSTWRRLLTDPQGQMIEIADRRLPSPAQARHVRARNRTCTLPSCSRSSRRAEIDHTVPWSRGGRTVKENLGPKCGKHHRMKHRDGRWRVTQPQEGTFVWVSPLGQTSVTTPDVYLEPESAQLPHLTRAGTDAHGAEGRAEARRSSPATGDTRATRRTTRTEKDATPDPAWTHYDHDSPPF